MTIIDNDIIIEVWCMCVCIYIYVCVYVSENVAYSLSCTAAAAFAQVTIQWSQLWCRASLGACHWSFLMRREVNCPDLWGTSQGLRWFQTKHFSAGWQGFEEKLTHWGCVVSRACHAQFGSSRIDYVPDSRRHDAETSKVSCSLSIPLCVDTACYRLWLCAAVAPQHGIAQCFSGRVFMGRQNGQLRRAERESDNTLQP